MSIALVIIKAIMIIGLSFGIIQFNYNKSDILFKVNILPITTIILSIIFGYQAYSTQDYMILQIWICIFLFSISILYAFKITNKNLEHKNINSLSNTNSVMNNQLDDIKMNKIYAFFKLNELLTNDLNFQQFKEAFLKTPIYLNMDVPSLREFFNFLKIQKGIYIKNIDNDFLQFFINSKTNQNYKYNQFISTSKPNSKLSIQIKNLFNLF
ncbi:MULTISPECIES: hypothetical protein [Empedobacter]|uniref:Uncharacterized protein n=1 Tax=Empedobacter falsenii TaxID=343874 RepID=A0AAW7DEU9_9FLAO|nr:MULTISPECIES: hypothetical protein [Empedobacter]MDM1550481.1 hypothetical protein [Empedobacter falsenii]